MSTIQKWAAPSCAVTPSSFVAANNPSATPMLAEPAPSMTICCSFKTLPRHLGGAENGPQGHCRRPLNVIIEGEQFIAIAQQKRPGMGSCEVFPLQASPGKFLLHRLNELVDEVVVSLAADPLVAPAEVLRIAEPFGVVGSHIQNNRQRPFRAYSADERIEG